MDGVNISNYDLLDYTKDYNGVSVLAHPYAMRPKQSWQLLKDPHIVRKIDAIESHNFSVGKYRRTMNKVGPLNKPLTAGTDSHSVSSFNALTGSYCQDVEGFLGDLLKKRNIIFYRKKNKVHRQIDHMLVFRNNLYRKSKTVPLPKFVTNAKLPKIKVLRAGRKRLRK